MIRGLLFSCLFAALSCASAFAADDSLETVEVTASREKLRKEILTFVHRVSRLDGEFVGRWRESVCPMVVGVTDTQAQFITSRLVEVQNSARRKKVDADPNCRPNVFIIITDEAEQVLADWRERDPGMFRWKNRQGVSSSRGTGPVRTWHNAVLEHQPGDAVLLKRPSCGLTGSRITVGCMEWITAVVVLVDARATGKVTLAQLADYISVVSLSQIDLSADLGGVDSILRLFAQPRPEVPPTGITEWDHAFLNGLYRVNYMPKNQQRDIAARMVRQLAPR